MRVALPTLCALLLMCVSARADRLVLKGGAVLDGKVTEQGDKVIVEVESGSLSFSRSEVERIERGESDIEKFEAKLAAIKPGDVRALIALANFCRDRGLPAREREVLRKVLESAPDHPEARARLGYVRTETGWVTEDEHKRMNGLVKYQGRWVTRAEMLELERLATQQKLAAVERQKAELELEAKRAELAAKKLEMERKERAQREQMERTREAERTANYPWGAPWFYPFPCGGQACRVPPPQDDPKRPPPFINGARHPSDMSFSLPGVRDPNSYF